MSFSWTRVVVAVAFASCIGCFSEFFEQAHAKNIHVPVDSQDLRCGFQVQAFFTPDDIVKDSLLALIEAEPTKIDVAAFRCTDPDFADALIDAYARGIQVTVVGDIGCLGLRSSKLRRFKQAGIPVFTYPAIEASKSYSLMHNKFVLFHGLECVWTGSLNFTTAAMNANQENVLLIHNKSLMQDYSNQFQRLIQRSTFL